MQPTRLGEMHGGLLALCMLKKSLGEPEMRVRPCHSIVGEPQPGAAAGSIVGEFARRSLQHPVVDRRHVGLLGAIPLGDLLGRHLHGRAVHPSERIRRAGVLRRPHDASPARRSRSLAARSTIL